MVVTDENGRVVIDESERLKEWVWSGSPHESTSFVYRRGISRDVPNADGSVSPTAVGLKPDSGWGSSFAPRRNGRYELRVEILEGDVQAARYEVTVKGVTGGWE